MFQCFFELTAYQLQLFTSLTEIGQTGEYERGPLNDYRRQCSCKDKSTHFIDEIFPYHFPADNVSACRCQCLAECTYQKIDVRDAFLFFRTSQSFVPAYSESVCFVYIQPYVSIFFFQTNQFAEIRFVSVHAEDAFRDDDDPFIFRVVYFYQPFQLVVLVVPVPDAFGCRQTYTVY